MANKKERGSLYKMKRIDFEHGTVTGNILGAALPMLVAQILNLLYNIVDRIYIARIPNVGTAALGAVGLWFSTDCCDYRLQQFIWEAEVLRSFQFIVEKMSRKNRQVL